MTPISTFISYAAIAFLILILILYIAALFIAYILPHKDNSMRASLRATFESNRASNVGIPCSALTSFVLVVALLKLYGESSQEEGVITLKFFGLDFTGPSGPVTLWAICFLCFISALKLLRRP